jgi:asparagine synthase (glutamine-hydrolysing)
VRWPWLHPAADAAANLRLADWRAGTPLRWNREIDWWWRSRFRTVLAASLETLAAAAGTQLVQPFFDATSVGAIVARYGPRGPADRSSAMRDLFGDVLPDAVLTRRGKAHLSEAFASDHTRAFVASWAGDGVDRSLVDVEQLALAWRAEIPDPRSLQLLQSAWLHTQTTS